MRRALPLALVVLGGCEALDGLTTPTIESSDYLMFAIGAVVPDGPPAADFQGRVPDGMTHFFDNRDPDNPVFECQHDDAQSLQKMEELNIPNDLP